MRPSVIVEADPVSDDAGRVLKAFKAVSVDALFLQGTDDAFDHGVPPWAMRGDELLAQAVAADQRDVGPAGKNQAVVTSEEEGLADPAEDAEPSDKRLLERAAAQVNMSIAMEPFLPALFLSKCLRGKRLELRALFFARGQQRLRLSRNFLGIFQGALHAKL